MPATRAGGFSRARDRMEERKPARARLPAPFLSSRAAGVRGVRGVHGVPGVLGLRSERCILLGVLSMLEHAPSFVSSPFRGAGRPAIHLLVCVCVCVCAVSVCCVF